MRSAREGSKRGETGGCIETEIELFCQNQRPIRYYNRGAEAAYVLTADAICVDQFRGDTDESGGVHVSRRSGSGRENNAFDRLPHSEWFKRFLAHPSNSLASLHSFFSDPQFFADRSMKTDAASNEEPDVTHTPEPE